MFTHRLSSLVSYVKLHSGHTFCLDQLCHAIRRPKALIVFRKLKTIDQFVTKGEVAENTKSKKLERFGFFETY